MYASLLLSAAALCVLTALIHSYFGEKRLIGPVVNSNHGVMANDLAKQVMRFAWHWTSVLWAMVAVYLAVAAQSETGNAMLLMTIGILHLLGGFFDAIITRGKHIGWPPILLIGVLVLVACFIGPSAL